MRNPILDVLDFHRITETRAPFTFQPLPEDRKTLRKNLINEEVFKEFYNAIDADDPIQLLDGAVDGIYVILGTLIEYGLTDKFKAAWDEIQRSNMSKVDPTIGIIKRADGKVLKPESYSPADIEWVFNTVPIDHMAVFSNLPEDKDFEPNLAVFSVRRFVGSIINEDEVADCKTWDDFKLRVLSKLIERKERLDDLAKG